METLSNPAAALPEAETPRGVQPGGEGFFVQMELGWGRLRRRLLRRFRPGYVRVMEQKRRGHCPDCCHDVIDSRDLKFCRNVCGYWFEAADDRYRWRDRLRIARAGWAELIGFSALFAIAAIVLAVLGTIHWSFWLLLLPLVLVWIEVVAFFRDPERKISTDANVLISPADGAVTHIGEVDDPTFPGGRAFRIGIFLSIFNVHVNRVPRTGIVTAVRYYRGAFLDARHADCPTRNEQLWIDFGEEGTLRPIRVKQISGAIARRIVCWLKPGDHVRAGDRFGMIKFGSRTEVLIPADQLINVLVKLGDQVKGGSTILLRFTGDSRAAT
jgi:phosphatidylserine decarboxylase